MKHSRSPRTEPELESIERCGTRLTLCADGYHRDAFGVRYDIRGDLVYREQRHGVWAAVRPQEPSYILGPDGKPLF